MPVKTAIKSRSKHQERTEATQAKLLHAAEDVFSRDGFANARLEQIAIEAGYTRGAIYAHYKSKEDLFLDLFEKRVAKSVVEVEGMLDRYPSVDDRQAKMRAMLVKKASDKKWAMLVLEFKLFALRQPKVKARMQRLLAMLHSTWRTDSLSSLFGEMTPGQSRQVRRRLALVGPVLTAAVLESHFRPDLLSGKNLDAVLEEVFASLVRV